MIFNIEFDQTDSVCEFLDIRANNAKEAKRVLSLLNFVMPSDFRAMPTDEAPETQRSSDEVPVISSNVPIITSYKSQEELLEDMEFMLSIASTPDKASLSNYAKDRIGICIARFYKHSNRKIPAIKMIRAIAGLGLKEAKELFEQYINTV